MSGGNNGKIPDISFTDLIQNYVKLQKSVTDKVKSLASSLSSATPGKFLLLQFEMSQVTQVGDSISNVISQVNSMINNSIRNQKGQ